MRCNEKRQSGSSNGAPSTAVHSNTQNREPRTGDPKYRHVGTIGLGTAMTVLCVVCGGFKLLARDKGGKEGKRAGAGLDLSKLALTLLVFIDNWFVIVDSAQCRVECHGHRHNHWPASPYR